MAIIIAFLAPVAVVCIIGAVKSFAQYCKDSRGVQAVLNK